MTIIYLDHLENGDTDLDAQDLLNTLKNEVVPKYLPTENIFTFTTDWSDNEGKAMYHTHGQIMKLWLHICIYIIYTHSQITKVRLHIAYTWSDNEGRAIYHTHGQTMKVKLCIIHMVR